MKIGNVEIKNRIVVAPMAGVTNQVFREICVKMGAGLVYGEMVSDKGLDYKNQKTLEMINVSSDEHPISMQIFGSEVDTLVKASKLIESTDSDIIDINMGCPVHKVNKSFSGAFLLKDPSKIYDIVSNVVKSVKKPVTVKIRSGWDHLSINAVEVAKKIEEAGASAIAIHGRTRSQLYTGKADWNIIKEVKNNVSIPVIGNGDIKTPIDALNMLKETNCDFIMIGRALLGNPWLIREINHFLNTGEYLERPTINEIIDMIKYHTKELIKLKGEKIGILEMRSHAAWYLKGLKGNTAIKNRIHKCNTELELNEVINDFIDSLQNN